jgi:IS30 family transposase
VSHETIYRSLFVQTRGVLKKELLGHLRSKQAIRRPQRTDPNGDRRGQIKDIASIRERPAAVEDRAVPGHWEGDLLSGSKNSYIASKWILVIDDNCYSKSACQDHLSSAVDQVTTRKRKCDKAPPAISR